MSRLLQNPSLDVKVVLELNEDEICALEALAGYGIDSFLKVFYAQMGQHYLRPHEAGLRSLFKVIQSDLPPILRRAKAARTAFVLRNPIVGDGDAIRKEQA